MVVMNDLAGGGMLRREHTLVQQHDALEELSNKSGEGQTK